MSPVFYEELDSPATPKARERVLTDPEIVKLWKTCDEEGFPFGTVLDAA